MLTLFARRIKLHTSLSLRRYPSSSIKSEIVCQHQMVLDNLKYDIREYQHFLGMNIDDSSEFKILTSRLLAIEPRLPYEEYLQERLVESITLLLEIEDNDGSTKGK